jgi:hypothetical protein
MGLGSNRCKEEGAVSRTYVRCGIRVDPRGRLDVNHCVIYCTRGCIGRSTVSPMHEYGVNDELSSKGVICMTLYWETIIEFDIEMEQYNET